MSALFSSRFTRGSSFSSRVFRGFSAASQPPKDKDRPPSHFLNETFKIQNTQLVAVDTGFTPMQAAGVIGVMKGCADQTTAYQLREFTSKNDHIELKAELSERVFNSSLKFDIANRQLVESLESKMGEVRSDLRSIELADCDRLQVLLDKRQEEYAAMHKTHEERFRVLKADLEQRERQMLRFGAISCVMLFTFLGAVGSTM